MGRYELAKTFIEKRKEYWKKIGYSIEYLRLNDGRLKVMFINHSENIPCYLEYLDTKIICYGDYGSYIFENYSSVKNNPTSINYKSIDYIIGKVDKTCNTKKFDYEFAIDTLEEWKKEYEKNVDEFELGLFRNEFDILIRNIDGSGNNIWSELEKFFQDLNYSDWQEEFSNIGMVYTPHILAQLVMMELIDEDYRKKILIGSFRNEDY